MTVSDETLMAYADGEVDTATRAIVEAAMRDDPEVRRRVAHHRALREAVKGAFAAVIDEPVPQRLIAAARGAPAGSVVDLAVARNAAAVKASRGSRWQPAAMAASLLLGLALGYLGWRGSNSLVRVSASGELVAGAGLALLETLSAKMRIFRAPEFLGTAFMLATLGMLTHFLLEIQ